MCFGRTYGSFKELRKRKGRFGASVIEAFELKSSLLMDRTHRTGSGMNFHLLSNFEIEVQVLSRITPWICEAC